MLGQISTTWEEMKMFVFSWTAVVNKAKTDAKSREMPVTAGAESILLLLIVPGMDVLTLLDGTGAPQKRVVIRMESNSQYGEEKNGQRYENDTLDTGVMHSAIDSMLSCKYVIFYHLFQRTVKGYHLWVVGYSKIAHYPSVRRLDRFLQIPKVKI